MKRYKRALHYLGPEKRGQGEEGKKGCKEEEEEEEEEEGGKGAR